MGAETLGTEFMLNMAGGGPAGGGDERLEGVGWGGKVPWLEDKLTGFEVDLYMVCVG